MSQLTTTPQNEIVPEWLRNLAAMGWRVLVSAALLVAIIVIAMEIGTVTGAILIAGIVAATFAPFVLRLRERGWSRTRAAATVTIGIVVVFMVAMALISLAFLPYVPQLVSAIQTGVAAVQAQLATLEIPPSATDATEVLASSLTGALEGLARQIAQSVSMLVTIVILAAFLVFFFLQDGDKAWVWMFQAAHEQQRERITGAGDDALERVGGYLRGTSVLAAINGLSSFVFLYLLGVPLAAPLAVMVFFGGFIPYIGGLLTTVVLLLVAYATSGAQVTVVLFLLIAMRNLIVSNVVRPQVYGRTVNIHPALVLVALPAGAAIAGIVGLFAAIPVAAMIMAVAGAAAAILDTGVPPNDPLVPPWLDRLAAWSWRLLVAIAVAFLLIFAFSVMPLVVLPLVLATILAATFAPTVARLVAGGQPRGRAALLTTFGAFALVTLVLVLTIVYMVDQVGPVVVSAAAGATQVDGAAGGTFGWLSDAVSAHSSQLVASTRAVAGSLTDLMVVILLGSLLCFYFLRDGGRFWQTMVERLATGRGAEVDQAGTSAFGVLGGYMAATGKISAFGAGTQFAIMVILGLPLAVPLAILSLIGGFIPYVGSLVTTGLALLVTVAVGSPRDVAVMLGFTIVFNVIQANIVAPVVYGRAVNLHPAVVLMAIPAGNEIAGVTGMFLAVPVVAVIAATWRPILRVFGTTIPMAAPAAAMDEAPADL